MKVRLLIIDYCQCRVAAYTGVPTKVALGKLEKMHGRGLQDGGDEKWSKLVNSLPDVSQTFPPEYLGLQLDAEMTEAVDKVFVWWEAY